MIPTYNQSSFLERAIESALAQTYQNLEVLVGDDASTDGTAEIVAKIHSRRFSYVRNSQNLGRTENYRRLLYVHASGDYIVNLDGDDYYTDKDFITKAIRVFELDSKAVMVVASTRKLGLGFDHCAKLPQTRCLSGMQILRSLPNHSYLLTHMATVYRRRLALDLDFYRSVAISSDWESLYRLALRGTVRYLDSSVGVWRIHGSNETRSPDASKQMENLLIWCSIFEEARRLGMHPIEAAVRREVCISYFAQASFTIISALGASALLGFIKEVFRRHPFASILILLTPFFLGRTLLSFTGYYKKKASIAGRRDSP